MFKEQRPLGMDIEGLYLLLGYLELGAQSSRESPCGCKDSALENEQPVSCSTLYLILYYIIL